MTRSGARALGALVLVAAGAGCAREAGNSGSSDALAEARTLLSERRFDEVLARVGEASDPDAAYLAGRAWAGKAASAPVPIAAPGVSPAGGAMKPEEERALGFYERAIAARPAFSEAHLALAELLAPHAVAAAAASGAASTRSAPRGPRPPMAAPDPLVSRVLQSYGNAMQSDPGGSQAAEGLIAFATRVGRLGEADAAFQELVRRHREDAALLVRYGDFLSGPAGKPEAALAQYAQALIWKPDDTRTKLKMADIYLAAAAGHLRERQWVAAEARLKDAKKYAVDPASPEAGRARRARGPAARGPWTLAASRPGPSAGGAAALSPGCGRPRCRRRR